MVLKPERAAAQAVAPLQIDPRPDVPPRGFEDFYTSAFRWLVKVAMVYGATFQEAEDAASDALEYMLSRWPIEPNPLAYARTATLNFFFKARQRGIVRDARRLIERGHVPHREGAEDERFIEIEGRQWLDKVLSHLSPAQCEVLKYVADGLKPQEIADIIGVSGDVVRQRVHAARRRLAVVLNPDGTYRQPESNQAHPPREEAR